MNLREVTAQFSWHHYHTYSYKIDSMFYNYARKQTERQTDKTDFTNLRDRDKQQILHLRTCLTTLGKSMYLPF